MQRVPGLAIIPARAGSTRVPGKNTRLLDGVPAIAHVIAACRTSGAFERIVVSTDDPGIADIAREAGADVPFMRPAELADDHTGIVPVIQHAVDNLDLDPTTSVACVYATAVTVDPVDLRHGLDRLADAQRPVFVVSVTEFDAPIQRALAMAADGTVTFLDPAHAQTRSQDLEQRWHDAAQFIWAHAATWRDAVSVWNSTLGLPIPHWRVIDIDTEADWRRAELVVAMLRGSSPDR